MKDTLPTSFSARGTPFGMRIPLRYANANSSPKKLTPAALSLFMISVSMETVFSRLDNARPLALSLFMISVSMETVFSRLDNARPLALSLFMISVSMETVFGRLDNTRPLTDAANSLTTLILPVSFCSSFWSRHHASCCFVRIHLNETLEADAFV